MARYVYYNRNPDGKKVEDCVTRAISLAMDMDYYEVAKKLRLTASLWGCDKLCLSCYHHLLDDVFRLKRIYVDGMTVEEFAETHPYGRYILRCPSHLLAVIDGTDYDIFNSTNMEITDAWKVD